MGILTFDETIRNHRRMWNWIADKTRSNKKIMRKEDYFKQNHIREIPQMRCFCCEYTTVFHSSCDFCPIMWSDDGEDACTTGKAIFSNFCEAESCDDWKEAAKLARQIANLPAREKRDEDI